MTTAVLYRGTDEVKVRVRLSQVPLELRQEVAHRLASKWKLRGLDYAMFLIRVSAPKGEQDVELEVPFEKYERVVREGKQPRGAMPPGLAELLALPPAELSL